MSEKYNGWSSYNTWAAQLWLSNDESSYRHIQFMARRCHDKYDLAQEIKAEVEEGNPLADQANMYSDMLAAALRDVNWYEIAEHWYDEAQEDE